MPQPFYYGGQALIEGVLIRGQRNVRMAVRRPDGGIWTGPLPLNPITSGRLRRIPLVRGVLVLAEALLMGMRGLNRSAEIAMADPDAPPVPDGEQPKVGKAERVSMAVTMAIALVFGIGIFFLPAVVWRSLARQRYRIFHREQLAGGCHPVDAAGGVHLAHRAPEGCQARLCLPRRGAHDHPRIRGTGGRWSRRKSSNSRRHTRAAARPSC